jgi:hypothetical protein
MAGGRNAGGKAGARRSGERDAGEAPSRTLGRTKGAGFEVGIRRTYDLSPAQAWTLLTSPSGCELLTGRRRALRPDGPGDSWDGAPVEYSLTTFASGSHFRMRWRLHDWAEPSILQVRVLPAASGRCAVAVHQEQLGDAAAREAMLARWTRFHSEFEELARRE